MSALPMLALAPLLAATLGFTCLSQPAADPADADADAEPDLSEARRLFDEGQARYEAADYEGAIEVFTVALGEVRTQGVDNFAIQGALLFNIGRAHVRAYEIDRDIEHLRQAQAIFTRFVEGAQAYPEDSTASDVAEARAQLDTLAAQLAELEQEPAPVPGSAAEPEPEPEPAPVPGSGDEPAPEGDRSGRARGVGIGLSAAGVALLGGGVGALVWGLGYGSAAQAQLAEYEALGLPEDHPVYDAHAQFVAQEQGKGRAWLGAGAAGAALGLAGVAVGVALIVKAKRGRGAEQAFVPGVFVGRGQAMLGSSGRF